MGTQDEQKKEHKKNKQKGKWERKLLTSLRGLSSILTPEKRRRLE